MASSVIVVSAVFVLSCGQTDRQTHRITDADDRYTHVKRVINFFGQYYKFLLLCTEVYSLITIIMLLIIVWKIAYTTSLIFYLIIILITLFYF